MSLTTCGAGYTCDFDPRFISGLAVWFDASDANSITSASNLVSQWNDKSGNTRHATAATTARPTLVAGGQNGKSILRFDGSANRLLTSAFTLAQPFTVLIVAKNSILDTTYRTVLGDTTTANGAIQKSNLNPGAFKSYAGANVTGPTADTSWHMFSAAFNGASSDIKTDGNAAATGSASTGGLANGLNIGGPASQWWNGDVAEVAIFDRILGSSERTIIENWLRNKWGTA